MENQKENIGLLGTPYIYHKRKRVLVLDPYTTWLMPYLQSYGRILELSQDYFGALSCGISILKGFTLSLLMGMVLPIFRER